MFLGIKSIIYNTLRIIAVCYFLQVSAFASEILIKENMSEISLANLGLEYRGKEWTEIELLDIESIPQDKFVRFEPS